MDLDRRALEPMSRVLAARLKTEFGLDLGALDALLLLDFIAEQLGPVIYNQALEDARRLLAARLEALGDALYDLEKPLKA